MKDPKKKRGTPSPTRIIACGVFKPMLNHLQLEQSHPHLHLTFLPSNLHLGPRKLKNRLLREFTAANKRNERVICLYGECFPDIDDSCKQYGIIRIPGVHCYEMLLGKERFQKVIDETAGTFFMERELILNFNKYCLEPLELYDEEMRNCCFQHYRKLLYVRQPSDPDLVLRAGELAEFLGLALEIKDADYSQLKEKLIKSINSEALT